MKKPLLSIAALFFYISSGQPLYAQGQSDCSTLNKVSMKKRSKFEFSLIIFLTILFFNNSFSYSQSLYDSFDNCSLWAQYTQIIQPYNRGYQYDKYCGNGKMALWARSNSVFYQPYAVKNYSFKAGRPYKIRLGGVTITNNNGSTTNPAFQNLRFFIAAANGKTADVSQLTFSDYKTIDIKSYNSNAGIVSDIQSIFLPTINFSNIILSAESSNSTITLDYIEIIEDVCVTTLPIDGTISASATSICLGQSVTISSRDGAGEPYYWASTNGGGSWDVFQGAYAGQSSFPYTPTQTGTFRFHLRNRNSCGFCWDSGNNGCPTFPYVDVVVNAIPSVYIAGDGATFCSGGSTALTAYGPAYSYYAWSTGEGGTRSINAYSSGTYSVTAYLNGCQSSAQATVYEQYCEPDPDPCSRYGICPCFDQFCPRKETPAGNEPSDDPNVSELSVFPNPAMAQVTVALPARVEFDTPVRFFDLLGRQQGNVNIPKGQWKVSVSLDQAAEGTYIIKVGQSGKSTKLIVKR